MLPIHVAEFVQSAQECDDARVAGLRPDHGGDRSPGTEDPDPIGLTCGLSRRDAGHAEYPEGEAAEEGAPIHQSITTSVCSWSNAGIHRPKQWIRHQCGERSRLPAEASNAGLGPVQRVVRRWLR